jgi:hypothetical protein
LAFIESSDATAIPDPEHRELGRASPGAAVRIESLRCHVVEPSCVRKPG